MNIHLDNPAERKPTSKQSSNKRKTIGGGKSAEIAAYVRHMSLTLKDVADKQYNTSTIILTVCQTVQSS